MGFGHPHFQLRKPVVGKTAHHLTIIDGLRAVGILLVVWYHLWLQTWINQSVTVLGRTLDFTFVPATGYIGVDILLFISGLGLFYSYALHVFEGEKLHSMGEYVYHRFIRIVPSYYLAILVAVCFFTIESVPYKNDMVWQLFTHLTFIHMFFQETQGALNGVLWTIGTEAQFYLVFPLLAYAFMKKPIFTFLGMVGVAYLFRMHGIWAQLPYLEFWTRQAPAFFDIYAYGMLAAYGLVFLQNRLPEKIWISVIATILAVVAVAAFVVCLQHLFREDVTVPQGRFVWLSYYRGLVGAIILLFVFSATFAFRGLQYILTNKLLLFFSVISYNWYLWHGMLILWLKDKHIPNWVGDDPHADPHWQIAFFVTGFVLSIIPAVAVTYLIERPLVKNGIRGTLAKFVPPLLIRGIEKSTL
jgi:peptidoglycan/LPS O-acetylase OafA/YrhL